MSDDRREFRVTDKRIRVDAPDTHAPGQDDRSPDAGKQPLEPEAGAAASGRVGELERELETAKRQADERYDQLLRLKAEWENFRKRAIREQTEIVDRAALRIVERLLPVLDDFDRAIEAARAQPGAEAIVRGMELVHRHLWEVLYSEGVERVEATGETFDPAEHEATLSSEGPVEEPTVLEVVRPGYRLKGRTIRPALVHVQTPGEAEEDPSREEAE